LFQIGPHQLAIAHDGIGEVGLDRDDPGHLRTLEIGPDQGHPLGVRRSAVGLDDAKAAARICGGQGPFAQVGLEQVRTRQIGPAQAGPAQIGPAKAGVRKVGLAQVGPEEVGVVQARSGQIAADQHGPGEIGVGEGPSRQVQP
jgi:hypothetical protein